jgi:hypothetical protein
MSVRCPRCNRFGKSTLGGYCEPCKTKKQNKSRRKQYFMRDLHKEKYGTRDSFYNESYGIVKDQCDLEGKNG